MDTKNCELCGKEYPPKSWNQKFCSDECRQVQHNYTNGKVYARYSVEMPERPERPEMPEVPERMKKAELHLLDARWKILLGVWGEYFPDKPQPRVTSKSYIRMLKARLDEFEFSEILEALEEVSSVQRIQEAGWFTLQWVLYKRYNMQKLLDGKYLSLDAMPDQLELAQKYMELSVWEKAQVLAAITKDPAYPEVYAELTGKNQPPEPEPEPMPF